MFHKFSGWLYTLLVHQSPKAQSAEIHKGMYGFTDEFTRNLKYLLTVHTMVCTHSISMYILNTEKSTYPLRNTAISCQLSHYSLTANLGLYIEKKGQPQ